MNNKEKTNEIIEESFRQLDELLNILIKDSNVSKSDVVKDVYDEAQKIKVKTYTDIEPNKSK